MSTDRPEGSSPAASQAPVPRTRAELRALREAEERAAAAAAPAAPAAREENPPSGGASAEISPPDRANSSPADAAADAPDADAPSIETPDAAAPSAETPDAAHDSVPAASAPSSLVREENPPSGGASAEIPPPDRANSSPADAARTAHTPRTATPAKPRPRATRFGIALAAVLGILVLAGAGLGAASLVQGPRLTDARVNAQQAVESSGSRVILTANQALADVDPKQVTVEPATPFTVDAAGRGVGIRFTVPLDDSTKYTVKVADVTGRGGGPSADLHWTFTTPAASLYLLNRDAKGEDKIFRTGLKGDGVKVFAHERINDFRATSDQLVVSVADDDGSHLLVMDLDGRHQRELPLPGEGYVGEIQVSDRGGLVGYSYSDKKLTETTGRASVLVTQSLKTEDEPHIIEVGGKEASVFSWRFVPDSAAVLFIDFDGALSLIDLSTDAGLQSLGLASDIQGVSRGTYTAIVERLDGTVVQLNLADGSEQPLAASDPDYGPATTITPFPGGTLRHVVSRDEIGMPIGQAIIRVDDKGAAKTLVEVGSTDSILQACSSPSGQYAAVVIAPKLVENRYDDMLLPLPMTLETHLVDIDSGKEIVALTGFDASWCQSAPRP